MRSTNLAKNSPERLAQRRAVSNCNAIAIRKCHVLVIIIIVVFVVIVIKKHQLRKLIRHGQFLD